MKKEMLINVLQPEESRIAILEDGVLEELYVERTSQESYVGNIYKGRIVNIEPSIQAAFVDFGVGRNGFLHVSDVEPTYYRHLEGQGPQNGGRRGGGRGQGRGRSGRSGGPRRRPVYEDVSEEGVPPEAPTPAEEILLADLDAMESLPMEEAGGKDQGAEGSAPEGEQEKKERHDDSGPYLMGSAERRTDEDDPPAEPIEPNNISDDELSFSRGEPGRHTTVEPLQQQEEAPYAEEPIREEELPAGEPAAELESFREEEMPEMPRPRRREGRGDRRGDERRRDDRRGRGRRGPGRPGMGRPKPLIQDIFKRGQEVIVQVIKEGIGTKGPTLSTYISIAGRYLVLMPGLNRIGVSRKIADEEQRRRLREILGQLKPPRGLGFIIRTAGLDRNKKELQRDLAYLSRLWQVVVRRIRKLKAPAEIYQESDMITRTIRDIFSSEIDTIWVDEARAFEHAQEFLQIVMPRYADRIKHYDAPEPMFHRHGIETEIGRIQQRHVPLPNGGSIVIDQTEALVAIDVNSGNFRADNNAEETAYQMNLLAAKEIARQLRLRDLGGVIVNDFIDMREEKHRRGVERALREAVRRDRARTKILRISAFGIIEMTRQRIRPSLKRSVYQDCPACHATGQVKTCESMSIDVMRLLQLAAHQNGVQRVQVKVHDDVAHYLLNRKRREIARLEEASTIVVTISGSVSTAPEFLEIVCYNNNNNEVKFSPYDESRQARRR
jgi:ribonuclease E